MRGLVQLDEWAAAWQLGLWSCATLPRDMGAEFVVLPGGIAILGASMRSSNLIAVSDRIAGTDLERPVMLHEAGHLMTRPLALSGCQLSWRTIYAETLAWCGAGRLSLSAGQARHIDRGEMSLAEAGDDNGVPSELCAIGLAIVHQLARPRGVISPAQRTELRAALTRWDTRLLHRVAALT